MGGKLRSVGLALKWRAQRHRPLEQSQILLPIPPSPYGQPSPRSGGRRVPKQRWVVARTETAGGMANKICGTSNLLLYERFGLVGKSRPCRGYAPAAPPHPRHSPCGENKFWFQPRPASAAQRRHGGSGRQGQILRRCLLARNMTAGWLTEFVESKASARGGQPGHLGNETLTQGISHAPRLENLATRSLHRIFIGRDTLNACIDRARNIPPAVTSKPKKKKDTDTITVKFLLHKNKKIEMPTHKTAHPAKTHKPTRKTIFCGKSCFLAHTLVALNTRATAFKN